MTTLECRDVSVLRGGVQALRDVSVSVRSGEAVGVIGPNGAGKTTLLDVLSGFLRPTRGGLSLDEKDVTDLGGAKLARSGLHRTFQGSRLFSSLTVEENIQVAALCAGARRADSITRCKVLMDALELSPLRHRRCQGLPQGITQRVVLARALATRPKVLLLDEPVAGLSEVETDEFESLVKGARDEGTALLVVEHHMSFVESLCDRAYVLLEGALLLEGTVQEVFSSPEVQTAYLGVGEEVTDPA